MSKSPQIGQVAPDVELFDMNGKRTTLYSHLGEDKTLLSFYRGYWCCVCYGELDNFRFSLPLYMEKGAKIISISVDEPNLSRDFSERLEKHFRDEEMAYELQRKPADKDDQERLEYVWDMARRALAVGDGKTLPFTLLSDPERKAIKKYGIVDVEGGNIAKPSVFLIDKKKILRWKHVSKHYFDRPTTGIIVKALEKMK